MFYTFYSFKGGVGRSMSLANVAELLYQSGLKVLMIDFDLEAPGLERFFDVPPEVQGHRGVIDLVHSFKALRALPGKGSAKKGQANNKFPFRVEPLLNFIVTIHEDSDGGALYLIPAGERPKDDYSRFTERVRTFDWDDFYLNWNGQEFFDWFRREANTIADVILVDSRTGITEMSGICTYHLADIVVMFVAANRQNLDGTSLIAEGLFKRNLDREAKLKNGEKPEQRGDQRQSVEILPVPSRIDLTESPSLNKFKAEFKEKLRKFTPEKLIFENNSFDDLKVPYIPRYAFFEKLAVAEPDQSVATDLIGAYGRIVSAMVQLASKDSRFFREYHRRSGRYSVLGPGATIPEPTQYFIGRSWILQSMDAWLSDSSPAVCLVTGEPGSGKTSLAYQLAMISQGEIGSEGLTNIGLGTLVYAHFCHPANVRTLDPLNFVRSAALALSSRFPEFVQALVEINGSDNTIEVQQKISATTAGGRIMKTQIGNISVEGLDVRTAYARLLLEPLNLMYKRGFSEPVIFLIDAIEATLTYEPVDNRQYDSDLIDNGSTDNEPRDNLVSLAALAMRRLPRQVRLILTSRSNPRVRRAFDKAMVMDLVTDSPDAVAGDIRSYALKMLELFPEEERSSIVDRIVGASSGNFLFAELLLNQILRESAKNEPIEVDLLPNGLEDVYQEYLQREIGSNLRRWNNQDALLLGVLAVSRAKGLTKQQLAGILNKSETKIDEMLEPWIQYLEGESPDGPFQPFHTSFRNFLLANQEYQIHPMEAHQAISNYFVKEYEGRWKKDVDEYALNYTPTHIVAALNAAIRRKDYLALKESLTALLADNSFLSAKADKFGFEELAKDLKKAPPDDAILGNLGLIYYYLREYDDAVITYEQALNMAREQRDKRAEYTILGNLGLAYRALGECEKAIVYYEQAVDIARSLKDRKSEGTNLGNLGLTFRDFGQMEKAEEMLEWALTIAREIGDISNESNWLGNLGNIYFDREQFEKAVEYYSQAQNLSRKNKERGGMGTWARNLGLTYMQLESFDQAIEQYQESLNVYRDLRDNYNMARVINDLGEAYVGKGEYELAITTYRENISLLEKTRDLSSLAMTYSNLGLVYRKKGDPDEAVEFYQRSLEIARQEGMRQVEGVILHNIGKAYRDLGEMEPAGDYYNEALAIYRDIGDDENESAVLDDLAEIQTGVFLGDKVGGDKFTVGNISGSGVAVGMGASAVVSRSISGYELDELFAPLIENIKKEFPGKERDEALVRAEDLIAELAQGTRSDDFRIATLILDLDEVTPNLNNNIYEIMTSPQIASYTGTATEFVLGRMKAG